MCLYTYLSVDPLQRWSMIVAIRKDDDANDGVVLGDFNNDKWWDRDTGRALCWSLGDLRAPTKGIEDVEDETLGLWGVFGNKGFKGCFGTRSIPFGIGIGIWLELELLGSMFLIACAIARSCAFYLKRDVAMYYLRGALIACAIYDVARKSYAIAYATRTLKKKKRKFFN